LYNILIEFGVLMKLVRLIKMCLNETYNKVRIGKHLSDNTHTTIEVLLKTAFSTRSLQRGYKDNRSKNRQFEWSRH
jgi:hypothetical protein